ncbi:hypothetical protein [Pseudomonas extremaustralis]|uniref:Uncharacterized protein n=1 Tax=Pseudomonas extremaustralis TaxID=359110 RepID=A0A5C5Q899_9PSED|nr:hypothetical protein [Pseudomonas extremaustralis]EZI27600.1 hypothetical protein PE143B_0116035 [Pseudomonas extremaustralis 14-3 substr. 14-3b]TWS01829.1 hypothetical protein FIV36_22875 [Pseudomonas extremaustralis]SDF94360.1 hypothetical protein SAMN05216591_4457 [Pseudomonas extremaustralis]
MNEGREKLVILGFIGVVVLCLGGVGFASWLGEKNKAETFAKERSDNCMRGLKEKAHYPSKVAFLGQAEKSDLLISGRVEFMNGFGAMIPFKYECSFYLSSSALLKEAFLRPDGS